MPLIETKGAASAQGFGEFAQSAAPVYIESCFSTYLYTGNGSTQTITNGIDLSGKGGLVWLKGRSGATNHALYDTTRGATKGLVSNSTSAEVIQSTGFTAFSGTGFSLGALAMLNTNADTYASWTFRKQAKFFDIVTYTGTGSNRTVSHNLGSVPGCIIVKRTDTTTDWQVYHRSLANTEYLVLNTTAAKATGATRWNSTTPTSTEFSLGTTTSVNASGGTYVAYLFAHDAGGFGLSGTDNVISCGSYTGNGSATGPVVTLGYEPQWLMIKNTSAGTYENWVLLDVMRGLPVNGAGQRLYANVANSEGPSNPYVNVLATGFQPASASSEINTSGNTYIYIAIRRGPMKVPTSGTSVFSPTLGTASGAPRFVSGFPTDLLVKTYRYGYLGSLFGSRLTGDKYMSSASTSAEASDSTFFKFDYQNGTSTAGDTNDIGWSFRRAPGFMDVVCYKGNNATQNINHNLNVIPELMICKARTGIENWFVYYGDNTKYLVLQTTSAPATGSTVWGNTSPTSSLFTVGGAFQALNCVAYLFATLAGVSKVGSYTGSGTTKQIDCGFTGGARFVLIKRTDSTGDWYVWDSARGIVSGNDPYLLLNSTAAEVTSTDYVDTYSAGFEISSTAPAAINANGGTFIFLAIA